MPSREPDFTNVDWTNPETARSFADEAVDAIHELVQAHSKTNGKDALWYFLAMHHCIACRVVESASVSILWLNTLFVWRCVGNYRVLFQPRAVGPVDSTLWVLTAMHYRKDPKAYSKILPAAAFAHISEDLKHALVKVLCHMEIDKAEFDHINRHIMECLDGDSLSLPGIKLKELFLEFFLKHFPFTTSYRNDTIRELRGAAWISAHRTILADPRMLLDNMDLSDAASRWRATSRLARCRWEARGRSSGYPEQDWYDAEQQVLEFLNLR